MIYFSFHGINWNRYGMFYVMVGLAIGHVLMYGMSSDCVCIWFC